MMRRSIRTCQHLVFVLVTLTTLTIPLQAGLSEYNVKAAFIHKFILFADYSKAFLSKRDDTQFHLCIAGNNPFGDAFRPVVGTTVKGRRLQVRQVEVDDISVMELYCDAVVLAEANTESATKRVLSRLYSKKVLTIAEHNKSLNWGSVIRIYIQSGKVVFDVHVGNGKAAGVSFRAQMLRIANSVEHRLE